MHISDVHDYSFPETEVVKEFLSQPTKKELKKTIEGIIDEEFNRLEDYAHDHISQVAADRAERFLERVLKGDEDAAEALLGDKNGWGRHRMQDGTPWAQLIHGRIFESGSLELRRKIVEAHADLIRNERIKDLESIVEGLTAQIKKQDNEIERMRDFRGTYR